MEPREGTPSLCLPACLPAGLYVPHPIALAVKQTSGLLEHLLVGVVLAHAGAKIGGLGVHLPARSVHVLPYVTYLFTSHRGGRREGEVERACFFCSFSFFVLCWGSTHHRGVGMGASATVLLTVSTHRCGCPDGGSKQSRLATPLAQCLGNQFSAYSITVITFWSRIS